MLDQSVGNPLTSRARHCPRVWEYDIKAKGKREKNPSDLIEIRAELPAFSQGHPFWV